MAQSAPSPKKSVMQCALWVWLSGLLPHVNKSQKAELSNLPSGLISCTLS